MNFLLDTHVWIWSLLEIDKLNLPTQAALKDPQNHFFLSPISVWETMLLIQRGKIVVYQDTVAWLQNVLVSSGVESAPLTHAVAIRSRLLPLPHQDPADRFIAATAVEYGLSLMTADQHLLTLVEANPWRVN